MASRTLVSCDRCFKDIPEGSDMYTLQAPNNVVIDLCNGCGNEFNQFLNALKTQPETPQTTEPEAPVQVPDPQPVPTFTDTPAAQPVGVPVAEPAVNPQQ